MILLKWHYSFFLLSMKMEGEIAMTVFTSFSSSLLTLAILLTSPTSTAAAAAQVQRTELGGVIYVVGVEGLRGLDTNLPVVLNSLGFFFKHELPLKNSEQKY